MNDTKTQFTHVAISRETKRKVEILATLRGSMIYKMIGEMVDREWQKAEKRGTVNSSIIVAKKE